MTRTRRRNARRKPRATAIGFLLAFVLTVATIIYTGLLVKAPHSAEGEGSSAQSVPQPDERTEEISDTPPRAAETPDARRRSRADETAATEMVR
jgi:hypothetical protein